eukprot:12124611-Alexandrium_andersonii.AAC.1
MLWAAMRSPSMHVMVSVITLKDCDMKQVGGRRKHGNATSSVTLNPGGGDPVAEACVSVGTKI